MLATPLLPWTMEYTINRWIFAGLNFSHFSWFSRVLQKFSHEYKHSSSLAARTIHKANSSYTLNVKSYNCIWNCLQCNIALGFLQVNFREILCSHLILPMSQQWPTIKLYTASLNNFPKMWVHSWKLGKFVPRERNLLAIW